MSEEEDRVSSAKNFYAITNRFWKEISCFLSPTIWKRKIAIRVLHARVANPWLPVCSVYLHHIHTIERTCKKKEGMKEGSITLYVTQSLYTNLLIDHTHTQLIQNTVLSRQHYKRGYQIWKHLKNVKQFKLNRKSQLQCKTKILSQACSVDFLCTSWLAAGNIDIHLWLIDHGYSDLRILHCSCHHEGI